MLLLVDVHAVLDHLYLNGTQPQITAPAVDYLRSPRRALPSPCHPSGWPPGTGTDIGASSGSAAWAGASRVFLDGASVSREISHLPALRWCLAGIVLAEAMRGHPGRAAERGQLPVEPVTVFETDLVERGRAWEHVCGDVTTPGLAAAGASGRQIADRLVLSVRTVDSHLHRAYTKLGVTSRDELAAILRPLSPPAAWPPRAAAEPEPG